MILSLWWLGTRWSHERTQEARSQKRTQGTRWRLEAGWWLGTGWMILPLWWLGTSSALKHTLGSPWTMTGGDFMRPETVSAVTREMSGTVGSVRTLRRAPGAVSLRVWMPPMEWPQTQWDSWTIPFHAFSYDIIIVILEDQDRKKVISVQDRSRTNLKQYLTNI